MDDSLREIGTGDLAVPKKVRRAATGLYERSMAYKGALDAGDDAALARALAEHVYLRPRRRRARALAGYMRAATPRWLQLTRSRFSTANLVSRQCRLQPRRQR